MCNYYFCLLTLASRHTAARLRVIIAVSRTRFMIHFLTWRLTDMKANKLQSTGLRHSSFGGTEVPESDARSVRCKVKIIYCGTSDWQNLIKVRPVHDLACVSLSQPPPVFLGLKLSQSCLRHPSSGLWRKGAGKRGSVGVWVSLSKTDLYSNNIFKGFDGDGGYFFCITINRTTNESCRRKCLHYF